MKPEPFGYFKPEPFGWTDCSETDEGAVSMYEQSSIDELMAKNYLQHMALEDYGITHDQRAQEIERLRAELTELNARIDDRNAALLSKTVELSECQKQRDELADELSECQKDRDYFKANDRCAMRYLSDVCNIVGGKDFPDMVKQVAVLQKQRDELLAAAKAIEINAEECLDWDDSTAMLVPIDDYHKLMEAIAKDKP